MATTSRLPGFYRHTVQERLNTVSDICQLSADSISALNGQRGLTESLADKMIENVVGTFALPVGLGLNFVVDGKERIVPMVVEEPSIVAAVGNVANLVRKSGGFTCTTDQPHMIAQVQLVEVKDSKAAVASIESAKAELMARGDQLGHDMVRFGGGMRDIEVRLLPDTGDGGGDMVVVHLIVDCRDAMGANTVNTIAEGLAGELERLSGGRVVLRILSNLADRRLASAAFRVPVDSLARGELSGQVVADNIIWAYRLAARDPYRAATHNKGIMNGIDAVAVATGNDWRSLEAGAHAYAAKDGRYTSLTTYKIEDGFLLGSIKLPMAVGTVGGSTQSHPTVKACNEILAVSSSQELAGVMAAVGLAQNMGALWALAGEGIQKGHMALHARQVALAAGALDSDVDRIARELVRRGDIRVDLAKELMEK